MAPRVWRSTRLLALAAMTCGTVLATAGLTPPSPVLGDGSVESVAGAGILDRVVCLGCAAALFGAGGATLGGMLLEATFFPEAFGACAYTCVVAFSE